MSVVITDRSDAAALIPVTQANEIVQGVVEKSVVMQLGTRLQNMSSKTHRIPVLNQLPQAHFVDGDTGLKQTSRRLWGKRSIHRRGVPFIWRTLKSRLKVTRTTRGVRIVRAL